MHNIQIDSEFQALIPPLSAEERAQLEANLLADGCRDPLVVWVQPAPEPGTHKCYAHDESKCDLVPEDHVVPVARGGGHEDENLTTACRSCNRSKRDKLVSEWRSA